MHCFLVCGFTGADGVGCTGELLVGCWHVCDSIFLGINC